MGTHYTTTIMPNATILVGNTISINMSMKSGFPYISLSTYNIGKLPYYMKASNRLQVQSFNKPPWPMQLTWIDASILRSLINTT